MRQAHINIDWSVFDRRVSDETVVAARWIDALLVATAGPGDDLAHWRDELADKHDRVLWHAYGRVTGRLLQAPPHSADAARLRELERALASELGARNRALPGEGVVDSDKQARVNALWGDYIRLGNDVDGAEPDTSLARYRALNDDIDAVIAREPLEFLRSDLHELRASVADDMAALCRKHGRIDEALSLYAQAASLVEQVGLARKASAYRLKIVELQYSSAVDFRAALKVLLQLRNDDTFVLGPLTRIVVERMLAETYTSIGDDYEALAHASRVVDGLTALGYAAPDGGLDAALLEAWIVRTDTSTDTLSEFLERLFQVLRTYMSCANVVSQASGDEAERQRAFATADALGAAFARLDARRREIQQRDVAYMRSLAPLPFEDSEEATPRETVFVPGDGGELAEYRRREHSGDCSEDLQQALRAAIDAADARGDTPLRDAYRDVLADVLFTLERYREAAALWRDASRTALSRGDPGNHCYHAIKWTGALAASGDVAALSTACAEAIDSIEQRRYLVGTPNQQSAYIEQAMPLYVLGVFAALKLSDDELMLQRIEPCKCAASVRDIRLSQASPAAAEADDIVEQIRELESRLAQMDLADAAGERDRRRRLYDLWELRRGEHEAHPPLLKLADVQAALAGDEAVLHYFWLAAEVLLVIALDGKRIIAHRQILTSDDIGRLRAAVDALDNMQQLSIDEDVIRSFQPLLLPDQVRPVLAGKRRLRVSPHGLLHVLPLHLLMLDDTYLFQRYAISYLPNLTALLLPAPARRGEGTFALGVSRFRVAGVWLPDLPAVVAELDALAQQYDALGMPAQVWRDEQASVARLRREVESGHLSGCRIWHIATHGEDVLDNAANPMETRLFLADGAVDGLEIGAWRLQADLVVLSVCHSGRRAFRNRLGAETAGGDEMFGLPAAFFKAGARAVLGALWQAHDATACIIMSSLHRHLRDKPPDFALQAAMQDYLDGPEGRGMSDKGTPSRDVMAIEIDDSVRNPARWAPFFLTQLGPLPR